MKKEKKGNIYDAKMILNKFTDDNVVEIYSLLLKQPYYVTDLYIKLRQEQSVTSQHLKKMRDIGIVSTKRDGKFIQYFPNPTRYSDICDFASKIVKIYYPTKVQRYSDAYAAYLFLQELWITQPLVEFLLKAKKPHKVKSIYEKLKIEQSVCSQALSRLHNIGIVAYMPNGKERLYTLNRAVYSKIINTVNEFVNDKHPAE